MNKIGVQSELIVCDENPSQGFEILKRTGFDCTDFSLNTYLLNTNLYKFEVNDFFDKSVAELENFFKPHVEAARNSGILINQMHMPYPLLVPNGAKEINDYLWNEVAIKSLYICHYMGCSNIVIHGFKLAEYLGSDDAEWGEMERFLLYIAPLAKELGITLCVENIYVSRGGHIIEGPCCNARKAAERIDRINDKIKSEVVGFCFDTGHANLVGIDFEDFLVTLGRRLKVLHIHDNDGIGDLHQMPFTFTRVRENTPTTDWGGFIRGLKACNFDGVLSFETAPILRSFPPELRERALAFIAEIGRYFAGEIAK